MGRGGGGGGRGRQRREEDVWWMFGRLVEVAEERLEANTSESGKAHDPR